MRYIAIAMCLALGGCGTTGKQVLDNALGCYRDYKGAISAGMLGGATFEGTVDIHCEPKVATPVPVVEPVS